jgi:hypothetical protein
MLGVAPSARAGDPIMPTSQVKPGMRCTAYTVVRGTEITTFDAEVVDVVSSRPYAPSIVVRVSGPAVSDGGVAAGFSGSPVYCPDEAGTARNIGAVAGVLGDEGNELALVTAIEEILREPVDPPGRRARVRAAGARGVQPAPLTVGGLSRPVERALLTLARRGGRPVIAAPRAPGIAPPFEPLRPGSSVAVGLSSGDLWIGGVGTVAYVDGTSTWLFGHSFEGVGRRSLLLQQAYVHAVVGNSDPALGGYKLASPGLDIGTVTNDGLAAVVGRAGTLPGTTDVRITARDTDAGRSEATELQVADESGVDLPSGFSPLSFVGPLAVADSSVRAMRAVPARQSGSMCARVHLAGVSDPLRLCNRYVVQQGGGVGGAMADDVAEAVGAIDAAEYAPLSVERVEADVEVRRGADQAYMLGVSMPRTVRRGASVPVSVRARIVRGGLRRFDFRLRVPRSLAPGGHVLTLSGPETDEAGALGGEFGEILIFEDEDELPQPARSFAELASQIERIERWDGVEARFSGRGGRRLRAYRDPDFRIGGEIKLRLRVRR